MDVLNKRFWLKKRESLKSTENFFPYPSNASTFKSENEKTNNKQVFISSKSETKNDDLNNKNFKIFTLSPKKSMQKNAVGKSVESTKNNENFNVENVKKSNNPKVTFRTYKSEQKTNAIKDEKYLIKEKEFPINNENSQKFKKIEAKTEKFVFRNFKRFSQSTTENNLQQFGKTKEPLKSYKIFEKFPQKQKSIKNNFELDSKTLLQSLVDEKQKKINNHKIILEKQQEISSFNKQKKDVILEDKKLKNKKIHSISDDELNSIKEDLDCILGDLKRYRIKRSKPEDFDLDNLNRFEIQPQKAENIIYPGDIEIEINHVDNKDIVEEKIIEPKRILTLEEELLAHDEEIRQSREILKQKATKLNKNTGFFGLFSAFAKAKKDKTLSDEFTTNPTDNVLETATKTTDKDEENEEVEIVNNSEENEESNNNLVATKEIKKQAIKNSNKEFVERITFIENLIVSGVPIKEILFNIESLKEQVNFPKQIEKNKTKVRKTKNPTDNVLETATKTTDKDEENEEVEIVNNSEENENNISKTQNKMDIIVSGTPASKAVDKKTKKKKSFKNMDKRALTQNLDKITTEKALIIAPFINNELINRINSDEPLKNIILKTEKEIKRSKIERAVVSESVDKESFKSNKENDYQKTSEEIVENISESTTENAIDKELEIIEKTKLKEIKAIKKLEKQKKKESRQRERREEKEKKQRERQEEKRIKNKNKELMVKEKNIQDKNKKAKEKDRKQPKKAKHIKLEKVKEIPQKQTRNKTEENNNNPDNLNKDKKSINSHGTVYEKNDEIDEKNIEEAISIEKRFVLKYLEESREQHMIFSKRALENFAIDNANSTAKETMDKYWALLNKTMYKHFKGMGVQKTEENVNECLKIEREKFTKELKDFLLKERKFRRMGNGKRKN